MFSYRILICLFVCVGVAGCGIRSTEEQCLQSDRLIFNDPDSLAVVQNMGSRGQQTSPGEEFFWLRYKAKNGYGAFVSANMACKKNVDKWERDKFRELIAIEDLSTDILEGFLEATKKVGQARQEAMKICKSASCIREVQTRYPYAVSADEALAQAKSNAKKVVFEGIANIK